MDIKIESTDGIEMRSEPVNSTEESTKAEPVKATEEPTTTEQSTITEQPMTALITSNMTTKIDDLTTKQAPPRVKLIRTRISLIDTEVEPILSCIYDKDTGLITNTSGDCYESCDNGKYLNVFFNENNILFCCCR